MFGRCIYVLLWQLYIICLTLTSFSSFIGQCLVCLVRFVPYILYGIGQLFFFINEMIVMCTYLSDRVNLTLTSFPWCNGQYKVFFVWSVSCDNKKNRSTKFGVHVFLAIDLFDLDLISCILLSVCETLYLEPPI